MKRLLQKLGWEVISISQMEWDSLQNAAHKTQFLLERVILPISEPTVHVDVKTMMLTRQQESHEEVARKEIFFIWIKVRCNSVLRDRPAKKLVPKEKRTTARVKLKSKRPRRRAESIRGLSFSSSE